LGGKKKKDLGYGTEQNLGTKKEGGKGGPQSSLIRTGQGRKKGEGEKPNKGKTGKWGRRLVGKLQWKPILSAGPAIKGRIRRDIGHSRE